MRPPIPSADSFSSANVNSLFKRILVPPKFGERKILMVRWNSEAEHQTPDPRHPTHKTVVILSLGTMDVFFLISSLRVKRPGVSSRVSEKDCRAVNLSH